MKRYEVLWSRPGEEASANRCISDLETLGKRLASSFRNGSFDYIIIHSLRPWGLLERAKARLLHGDSRRTDALAASPAPVLSIDQEQQEESERTSPQ